MDELPTYLSKLCMTDWQVFAVPPQRRSGRWVTREPWSR